MLKSSRNIRQKNYDIKKIRTWQCYSAKYEVCGTDHHSAPDAVRYEAERYTRQWPKAVRAVVECWVGRYAGTDSQISGVEQNTETADHDE